MLTHRLQNTRHVGLLSITCYDDLLPCVFNSSRKLGRSDSASKWHISTQHATTTLLDGITCNKNCNLGCMSELYWRLSTRFVYVLVYISVEYELSSALISAWLSPTCPMLDCIHRLPRWIHWIQTRLVTGEAWLLRRGAIGVFYAVVFAISAWASGQIHVRQFRPFVYPTGSNVNCAKTARVS